MDSTVHYLFNLLPAAWQPYVVLVLLAAYLITKWRSASKSATIAGTPPTGGPKDVQPKKTLFGYAVEFFF